MQRLKKALDFSRAFNNLTLAVPIFPTSNPVSIFGAVSLTTVFEMGTGVAPQLLPPGNFNERCGNGCALDNFKNLL